MPTQIEILFDIFFNCEPCLFLIAVKQAVLETLTHLKDFT